VFKNFRGTYHVPGISRLPRRCIRDDIDPFAGKNIKDCVPRSIRPKMPRASIDISTSKVKNRDWLGGCILRYPLHCLIVHTQPAALACGTTLSPSIIRANLSLNSSPGSHA